MNIILHTLTTIVILAISAPAILLLSVLTGGGVPGWLVVVWFFGTCLLINRVSTRRGYLG